MARLVEVNNLRTDVDLRVCFAVANPWVSKPTDRSPSIRHRAREYGSQRFLILTTITITIVLPFDLVGRFAFA